MSKKDKKQEEINTEAAEAQEAQTQSEYMDPSEAAEADSASKQDEMQAKIDYYIDIARRTQADFDNYRKRTLSARLNLWCGNWCDGGLFFWHYCW